MISGATRGAGGAALGNHLGNAWGNEEVRTLEGRGLTADSIRDQVAELTRMGSHARTCTPLYHLHADPPPGKPWTPEERAEYWRRTEAELGLEGRPFAAVMHVKHGREHEHRVYLRVHADGRAIRMDHDYARREKLGRVFEFDRGDSFTKGSHNRAVIAFLDRERPDVAAAMRAAKLHEGPPARAPETPIERMVRERREAATDRKAMAAYAVHAWAACDGQEAFAAALADAGLRLARGDRKAIPVVLDGKGKPHELGRLFAAHAKASGEPVPGKEDVAGRIDVAVLPSVAQAQATQRAMVEPTIDVAVPVPHEHAAAQPQAGAAAPVPGQPAAPAPQSPATAAAMPAEAPSSISPAGSRGGTQTASGGMANSVGGGGGAGGSAPATDAGGGAGASLEDVGDAPGLLKPNASPDERAKHIAAWAAYEDRKAAAWKRWISAWEASARKAAPAAASGGGQGHGDVQQAEAAAEAVRRLLDQWDRARTVADLRGAVAAFEAECDRIRTGIVTGPSAAGHGDDRGAGPPGSAGPVDAAGDARAGGPGGGIPGRHGDPAGGRGADPDRGAGDSRGVDRGEPAPAGGEGRPALERHAAQVRLARGLAAQPEAMARLRRARLELDPAWRERRDAYQRIRANRVGIAATLATHPHPDPADRDPAARATLYAGRVSDGYRDRKEAMEAAQAQAEAALHGRSLGTRLLAVVGVTTPQQRHALAVASHALALTDEELRLRPTPETYKEARADGAAHAYAAQADTRAWERKPKVCEALEQARLNVLVDKAAGDGDPAVSRALRAGDPAGARAVIQSREEEQERRMGMQPSGGPGEPGGDGFGFGGPR